MAQNQQQMQMNNQGVFNPMAPMFTPGMPQQQQGNFPLDPNMPAYFDPAYGEFFVLNLDFSFFFLFLFICLNSFCFIVSFQCNFHFNFVQFNLCFFCSLRLDDPSLHASNGG